MASRFYGAKGDAVRLIQRQLNKAGAGIHEDGVWGDETEEAYNKLSGQLLVSENSTDTTTSMQAVPADEYDQDLQFAKDKAKRLTDAVQSSIERLDPDYKARLDALEKAYGGKKRDLQGETLSKGMERSSYSGEVQKDEYDQWRSGQAALLEEKKQKLEDLNADIANIQANLTEAETKINRKKLDAEQKTSHRGGSGGGGKKSGGLMNAGQVEKKIDPEKKKQWELDVMQSWYRMSTSAKEAYFDKNWQYIHKQSPQVARQMAKDLEKATGRQYIFSN